MRKEEATHVVPIISWHTFKFATSQGHSFTAWHLWVLEKVNLSISRTRKSHARKAYIIFNKTCCPPTFKAQLLRAPISFGEKRKKKFNLNTLRQKEVTHIIFITSWLAFKCAISQAHRFTQVLESLKKINLDISRARGSYAHKANTIFIKTDWIQSPDCQE